MHFDLYKTYTDKLTRNIITYENVNTRLLLIRNKPMSVSRHMIRTTIPVVHNVVVVVHQQLEPNHFSMNVILNKSNNKIFHYFLSTVSLPMTQFFVVITDVLRINFVPFATFAFLLLLLFSRINHQ